MATPFHPPKRDPLCPCRYELSTCGDLRAIRGADRCAQSLPAAWDFLTPGCWRVGLGAEARERDWWNARWGLIMSTSTNPAGFPRRCLMAAPDQRTPSLGGEDSQTAGGGRLPTTTSPAQRYVLGEEIARGGMGVIYRATDAVLGRDVAVKVLQEKYGPESGAAARFAGEARITGQLQHPSIPPVHDLGVLADGRP